MPWSQERILLQERLRHVRKGISQMCRKHF